MAKRSLITLLKEGIAGIPLISGISGIVYKAYEFGDYLSKTIKVEPVNPDFIKFGVPAVTLLTLGYIATDIIQSYDQNLLERQLIKDQKKMQKLQEEKNDFDAYMQKKQKDLQELQEEVQELETVKD